VAGSTKIVSLRPSRVTITSDAVAGAAKQVVDNSPRRRRDDRDRKRCVAFVEAEPSVGPRVETSLITSCPRLPRLNQRPMSGRACRRLIAVCSRAELLRQSGRGRLERWRGLRARLPWFLVSVWTMSWAARSRYFLEFEFAWFFESDFCVAVFCVPEFCEPELGVPVFGCLNFRSSRADRIALALLPIGLLFRRRGIFRRAMVSLAAPFVRRRRVLATGW